MFGQLLVLQEHVASPVAQAERAANNCTGNSSHIGRLLHLGRDMPLGFADTVYEADRRLGMRTDREREWRLAASAAGLQK